MWLILVKGGLFEDVRGSLIIGGVQRNTRFQVPIRIAAPVADIYNKEELSDII